MLTDLKTLLERFANGTSFDDIIDSINQIYRDADRDPELKDWFKNMDKFVRKCLKEQGYVLKDESNQEWNGLYDHGHYLLRERYQNHTNRIADEFKHVAAEFDKDPQNKAFANSMNKLFLDLGNDENGQPTFKPPLIKDLTGVILPSFFEHIRYVPIPRIEYSDPMIDAVVENLVLEGDNLAPNIAEFGSDNYWRWGRAGAQSRNKNKVMLSVSGIQMDLRDVAYYIKKKQGFPGITDKGVMDIFMGGTGLSFKVAMETADAKDQAHFFKINTIVVDIKNMNIKLKQSNHKLLFGLFKPLLLKVMRPVIQKVVEKQLKDNIQQLDAIAYKIKKEADRAQEEAKSNPDPEHLQNMYQRYFTAFQQQMSKAQQKKEEAKAKTADKHVNVAVTQHDSMFKNISLPGGISSKATEYKNLANKGDKWESPVFSIGSARESSNLPSVAGVQRKSHGVTQGGVTGGRGLEDREPRSLEDRTGANGSAGVGGQGQGLAGQGLSGQGLSGQGLTGQGYDNQSQGLTGAGQGYGSQAQGLSSQAQGLAGQGQSQPGFANQLDGAFQGNQAQDLGLNSAAAAPTHSADGTLLGSNNPVLQGRV